MLSDFYKENPESKIWLIDELDTEFPEMAELKT